MTAEKFIAFVEKLLEKTKSGEIKWKRYQLKGRGIDNWADGTKSFSCTVGNMRIDILFGLDSETMEMIVKYDESLPAVPMSLESDKEYQTLLRLINYIYDLFPNLEKSIDNFLNGNQ